MKTFHIEANNQNAAQIGKQIQGCETLDDVVMSLRFESSPFADWFIYRGGNHVAVHTHFDTQRTALITLRRTQDDAREHALNCQRSAEAWAACYSRDESLRTQAQFADAQARQAWKELQAGKDQS